MSSLFSKRFLFRIFLPILLVVGGLAWSPTAPPVEASTPAGLLTYYIPADEDTLFNILDAIGGGTQDAAQGTHSVIAVTAWADQTTIYYDHWEDGYDLNEADPGATADEIVTLDRGDVATFESSAISLPRPAPGSVAGCSSGCDYDGGDRILTAGGAATVTRAGWTEDASTLLALSWEIYPVKPFLDQYTIPAGEDLASTYVDFEAVYALIQALEPNTTVEVDEDGDGNVDFSTVLGQGETISRTDLQTGGTINASAPVQVQYIIGDVGATYEVRGFSAVPDGLWDFEYYAPVRGAVDPTDIFIFNPSESDTLTISYSDTVGTGQFTIPPSTTVAYSTGTGRTVPVDSAVYLQGDGIFWALSTVDTTSSTHDWAYSLVPAYALRSEYFVGWAPGSDDNDSTPGPDEASYSPLFVTTVQDNTILYVDEDADGTPEQQFTIDRLDSQRVVSTLGDNDLTGTHLWATAPIAVAYGQDPDTASTSSPALDLGYTTLPIPESWMDVVLTLEKSADPVTLPAGAGNVTTFSLTASVFDVAVEQLTFTDDLPVEFDYVPGSTTITLPDDTILTNDPATSGQQLTWNLEAFQSGAGNISPFDQVLLTFQATTNAGWSAGAVTRNEASVSSSRTLGSGIETFSATDDAFNAAGALEMSKSVATATSPVAIGDIITYTITVTNPASSTVPLTGISISDPLPDGISYVPGSSNVTYPAKPVESYTSPNLGPAISDGNDPRTLSYDTTGYIPAGAVLQSYALDVSGSTIGASWLSEIGLQATYPGGTAITWSPGYFGGDGNGTYAEASAPAAVTGTAEGTYSFIWTENYNDTGDDNQIDVARFTITYAPPAGIANRFAGEPPTFVAADDGYTLDPGESLTLTFNAQVNSDIPDGHSSIVNVASVTSDQTPIQISDVAPMAVQGAPTAIHLGAVHIPNGTTAPMAMLLLVAGGLGLTTGITLRRRR